MKAINNYISALLIATVFAVCSCADSAISDLLFASDSAMELSLSTYSIEIDAHSQSREFSIKASDDLNWYMDNIPSWITVSTDKGTGSISPISILFKENNGTERSDSIMIKLSDSHYTGYIPLGIKQSAAPEPEYVDLGLSVNWATFNVGAMKPEEFGDYFAWGDPEPYYESGYAQENPQAHWKSGKTDGYSNLNYKFLELSDQNTVTILKYNTEPLYGPVDNKTVLEPEDDIAHVKWGGDWRMPTRSELIELLNNCTWKWIKTGNSEFDGVAGYMVTSKVEGYTDCSIFLPAAGIRDNKSLDFIWNCYWTSSLNTENVAPHVMLFSATDYVGLNSHAGWVGLPVRPVSPSTAYLSVVAKIELSQSVLDFSVNDAPVRLIALAKNNFDDEIQTEVQWISSDESVVIVSDDGTVTAVGAGTCIVSAVAGNIKSDCIVNVTDNDVLSEIVSGYITVSVNDYFNGIKRKVAVPRVVTDPDDPGNRCIVVTTNIGYYNNYDAQLFLEMNEEVESGDTILLSMRYKADKYQTSYTEVHSTPQNYIYGGLIPSVSFSTDWQGYEHKMVVYDPARTYTINLSYLSDGNNCYFDDISVKILSKGKSGDPEGAETTLDGITYRLYKEIIDWNDYRSNPDGAQFIKSRLLLDVINGGSTDTYQVGDNLYFREDGNSYSCMALDPNKREIIVFASSKTSGVNYGMDGNAYVSSLDDISFSKEKVFSSANWGWWSYFTESADGYVLRHFSFDGNYNMESKRNGVDLWSSSIVSSGSASKAAVNRIENGRALVCGQKPSVEPEYVDLGLSVKWATFNVGASRPEEYGDYFAWGEVDSKNDYSQSKYKYSSGSDATLTKYCNDSEYGYEGFTDGKTVLDLEDDVAHVKWSGNWRMPTIEEFNELIDNCSWMWIKRNGVNGYKITSNKTGYENCSIFLPVAGIRPGTSLEAAGSYGIYWSSSLRADTPSYAWVLYSYSDNHHTSTFNRSDGLSVRPVSP